MNVAVIGASNKSHRYSYQAVMLLKEKGHKVYPVHKKTKAIKGMKAYESISDIDEEIDTITMYVSAKISALLSEDIITKFPKRIIFNPGAENSELEKNARNQGINTINACTLVLLKTGQF